MPSDNRGENHRRVEEELRGSLAENADRAAALFESLADFHDRVAAMEGHPLAGTARRRADEERRFAKKEREASIRLRAECRWPVERRREAPNRIVLSASPSSDEPCTATT